ncbi:Stk1 family PASTA domain-containing Ser/Thr kinase [Bacillus niameyensis]|uniref:Stk1 family PASTA domain-containing Ser/Thr kinase n=1 Tax=Bacillus niameyensis TaxID=1522308 RepID=UPI000782A40B|nr:Stk1 family PASTA domain-containing Ser/Thr kinase [Bacillus niameyensis]
MLVGKRVSGRYKVLRLIGGGGMANVYLAHDMILDRDVAIKTLRLDYVNEDEFIRRFQREAQSATSLTHENIVSIYDVGEENDIYYIVMEYVDGMTLKQYIQNYHPIPIEKTIDIMKQLTSAVAHAHQNHIVHRDIKPQNILIDHRGNVMITDFGIAMALSATSITQTNSVLGSVHYLSPEQARGGMATKKSDIYSLGIVMFELLTGRLPFSGESAISIALKHLQSDTPSPKRWDPSIPQSVENIVLKATAKDPFIRYESAEEMQSDLETALDPNRVNEGKFVIPEDNDATKAIPIITSENYPGTDDHTITHQKEAPVSKQEKQAPKKKKRKKWPWIVGILGLFFILALVFFMIVLPALREAQNVTIPDVTDEELEDATVELLKYGLEIGEVQEEPSSEIAEGKVIKTSPRANKEVKKGEKINIFVSSGKEKVTLSDYTSRQYDEVVRLLTNEGFKEPLKEEKYDASAPGTIIEQSPAPNSEVVPDETTISFVVSKGEEKIELKDLRGNNLKGLENYEESTGLVIVIKEEYNDDVAEGLVISQDPAPGKMLSKGDKVTVVLSKGQEIIPPKTVTVPITIPYEPAEEEEQQKIVILIDDFNHSMTEPAEEPFMIEETIVKELQFTIEKGKKAYYKVVRDDKVIIEDEIDYPENE